mgnify:CR=1 FL=1|jgi:hypothetical protein
MTDVINQGKGPVKQIWGTSNEIILRDCYLECKHRNINFYDPPKEEVALIKSSVMTEGT